MQESTSIAHPFADPAEHWLEPVNTIAGVEYINDSRAVVPNAAWYALERMDRPVIWITGGVDGNASFEETWRLSWVVGEKVRLMICVGKDNRHLHRMAYLVDMVVNLGSMNEAVRLSHRLARKGEVVLLSPGCGCSDLFKSYEDRGRRFKRAVKDLPF